MQFKFDYHALIAVATNRTVPQDQDTAKMVAIPSASFGILHYCTVKTDSPITGTIMAFILP